MGESRHLPQPEEGEGSLARSGSADAQAREQRCDLLEFYRVPCPLVETPQEGAADLVAAAAATDT